MDIPSGFFGLQLEPGKSYTTVTAQPFRITMAALDEKIKGRERTSVKLKYKNSEYVICSLIPGQWEQQVLNLAFTEGEKVTFYMTGGTTVFLSGYVLEPDYHHHHHDEDGEDEDDEFDEFDEFDEDDEESDEEFDEDDEEFDEFGEEFDEEDDGDETPKITEIDDDEEIPTTGRFQTIPIITEAEPSSGKKEKQQQQQKGKDQQKQGKQDKQQQKPQQQQQQGQKRSAEATPEQKAQKPKLDQSSNKQQQQQQQQPKKFTLGGGLQVEEVKIGTGKKAKKGDQVKVQYIGKLTNGKVFDKGNNFSFNLGRGEVIKGWDLGVEGMAVGGERNLTIPAHLAYGKKGAGRDIPPNATLVFNVKLVGTK